MRFVQKTYENRHNIQTHYILEMGEVFEFAILSEVLYVGEVIGIKLYNSLPYGKAVVVSFENGACKAKRFM